MIALQGSNRAAPRHLAGFGVVVILHIGLGYLLVTGSGQKILKADPKPLMTTIIKEATPPPVPRPPPMPKLQAPAPPFIPLPEVAVRPVAQSNAIAQVTTVRPADPVPVEPGPVVSSVVAPVIDAAHSCRKPEYPPLSRRMEESGTVVLEFLIDLDGRVAEGRVAQSSGYERLDEAARQALSLCRFRPGMVNGVPEPSWAQLRYTWKLG